jgi:exopolysaccharide biosynthesis protein
VYRADGPWVINIVESELTQQYLELHSLLGQGNAVGRRGVSGMLTARASDSLVPVAAVNGDYFAMTGGAYTTIPLGFQVEAGEPITFPEPDRSVFYILSDGSVHIDRLKANAWLLGPSNFMFPIAGLNRPPEHGELTLFTPRFGKETRCADSVTQLVLTNLSAPITSRGEVTGTIGGIDVCGARPIPDGSAVLTANGVAAYALRHLKVGDQLRVQTAMYPEVGVIRTAVGGGPRLVRNGQISVENRIERFADAFANRRHPRTGIGLRDSTIVMVTVDGRQPGYSEGMTLHEFAQLFLELGCREAVNLDGGGSTTMVVRNRIVNSPSDGAERRVANALALFSTAPVTGKPEIGRAHV